MENNNKNDFMKEVIMALAIVCKKYNMSWPNKLGEKAFKEELLEVVSDLIKKSFKNGIRVGQARAGQEGNYYKKGGAH